MGEWGNGGMGEWEWGTGNGERGTGHPQNGESLKNGDISNAGIFKMGNL